MLLAESKHLTCKPERAVAFFMELDEHYLDWHPDHVAFAWRGPPTDRRSRFFFDERIGRVRLRMAMTVRWTGSTRIVCTPRGLHWRAVLRWMTFEVEPEAAGTRFTHRISLRLGPFARFLERPLLAPLRRHMAEEADNLEQLTRPQ